MTTLKSILGTEHRPEIIFDHVHRRHSEIDAILGDDRAEFQRSYEALHQNVILDLFLIRNFYDGLTGCRDFETMDKLRIHCDANRNLRAAADRAGITKAENARM